MIKPGSPRGLTVPLPEFEVQWAEFLKEFPSDEHATEGILQKYFGTPSCYYCKSEDVRRAWGRSVVSCNRCCRETHLFANTFFARAAHVRAYVAAIWLREKGIGMSMNFFSKILRISQSTGWELQTKLNHLIASCMTESAIFFSSSLLQAVFTKRSRETEAREHPRSEQDVLDQNKPQQAKDEQPGASQFQPKDETEANDERQSNEEFEWCNEMESDGELDLCEETELDRELDSCEETELDQETDSCEETESDDDLDSCNETHPADLPLVPLDEASLWSEDVKIVFDAISSKPKSVDVIVIETGLSGSSVSGAITVLRLILKVIVAVNSTEYVRAKPAVSSEISDRIAEFVRYFQHVNHGISRKNSQPYVGALWCLLDRKMWSNGTLFKKCVEMCPKSRFELRDYVSPLILKSMPA